jgi:DNA-binding NarL/FixJ family response regulator
MIAHGTTLSHMPVLAVVPDLYFATRIAATAKAIGVELDLVTAQRVLARLAEPGVSLVVMDLHQPDPLALIGEMKRVAPAVPVVGFYSHVESALQRDALAAGVDAALPRSQFVTRLPTLLERGLAALAGPKREDLRL